MRRKTFPGGPEAKIEAFLYLLETVGRDPTPAESHFTVRAIEALVQGLPALAAKDIDRALDVGASRKSPLRNRGRLAGLTQDSLTRANLWDRWADAQAAIARRSLP